jgi:hypothetical protein
MINPVQIPVAEQADGSIAPNPMGPGFASVNIQQEPGHPKTAIIAFFGSNQALVNFDDSGRSAINYTMLNPGATVQVQQSVMNIINYLTQLH